MKKQLFISGLLTFMSFNAMSSELLNNPMVNSRLASSAIFTQQNDLSTVDINHVDSDKESKNINNSTVNSRLASSAIFTEQNSLNNGASQETSPQNHSTDGVNNPLVNPMLASSVIFTDQDSFRNDMVERSTPTVSVLLADATK